MNTIKKNEQTIALATERLLDLLLPPLPPGVKSRPSFSRTRAKLSESLHAGHLDERFVDVERPLPDNFTPEEYAQALIRYFQENQEEAEKLYDGFEYSEDPITPEVYAQIFDRNFKEDREKVKKLNNHGLEIKMVRYGIRYERVKDLWAIPVPEERLKAYLPFRVRKTEPVPVQKALDIFQAEEIARINNSISVVDFASNLVAPTDELVVAQTSLLQLLKDNPHWVYSLSPRGFEELIAELFEKAGFHVDLTATTRDGGCDLIAVSYDGLEIPTKYVVEAKRYSKSHKVGVGAVRQLSAVRQKIGAHQGVLVTTSYFSKDAIEENRAYYQLNLRDYDDLIRWFMKA